MNKPSVLHFELETAVEFIWNFRKRGVSEKIVWDIKFEIIS